jgi:hypothetical protein
MAMPRSWRQILPKMAGVSHGEGFQAGHRRKPLLLLGYRDLATLGEGWSVSPFATPVRCKTFLPSQQITHGQHHWRCMDTAVSDLIQLLISIAMFAVVR